MSSYTEEDINYVYRIDYGLANNTIETSMNSYPAEGWTYIKISEVDIDPDTKEHVAKIYAVDEDFDIEWKDVKYVTLYFDEVPRSIKFGVVELLDEVIYTGDKINYDNYVSTGTLDQAILRFGEYNTREGYVNNFSGMFEGCNRLTMIKKLDISRGMTFTNMFKGLDNIQQLDLILPNPGNKFEDAKFMREYYTNDFVDLYINDVIENYMIVDAPVDEIIVNVSGMFDGMSSLHSLSIEIPDGTEYTFDQYFWNNSYFKELRSENYKLFKKLVLFCFRGCYSLYSNRLDYLLGKDINGNYSTEFRYPWRDIDEELTDLYTRKKYYMLIGQNNRNIRCVADTDDSPDARFNWYISKGKKDGLVLHGSNYDSGKAQSGNSITNVATRHNDLRVDSNDIQIDAITDGYYVITMYQSDDEEYAYKRGLYYTLEVYVKFIPKTINIIPPEVLVNNNNIVVLNDDKDEEDHLQFGYEIPGLNDNTQVTISWKSSNNAACSISKSGLAKPKKAVDKNGITITVVARIKFPQEDYRQAITISNTYTFYIVQYIKGLYFSKNTYTYDKKELITGIKHPVVTLVPKNANDLTTKFTYTLDDKVLTNGYLPRNFKTGAYILTCKAYNSVNNTTLVDSTVVKIINKVTKVEFDIDIPSSGILTMVKGKAMKLFANVYPKDADNPKVIFTSNDNRIASIDEDNILEANRPGTTWIYVTSAENPSIYAKFKLEVIVPIEAILINNPYTQFIGTSYQLEYQCYPYNTTQKYFEWSTSDSKILDVDQNGKITANSLGFAKITATNTENPDIKHTINIEVTGYEIECEIVENDHDDIVLLMAVPNPMQGLFIKATLNSGINIYGEDANDIPLKDVKYMTCCYPTNEFELKFTDNVYIRKILKCDIPITNGMGLFSGCRNLVEICDLKGEFEVATAMFYNCDNLISIPNIDTSKVLYASDMLANCKMLKRADINMPKCKNWNGTYRNCVNIEYIANIGSSKASDLNGVVSGCDNLKEVGNILIGKANANRMFISNGMLEKVHTIYLHQSTSAISMFEDCTGLLTFPNFSYNYSRFNNCTNMFKGCINMEGTPEGRLFWESNCRVYKDCFAGCTKLSNYYTEIPYYWGGDARVQQIKVESNNNNYNKAGDIILLTAESYPEYATNIKYNWSIEDKSIATILGGEIRGHKIMDSDGNLLMTADNQQICTNEMTADGTYMCYIKALKGGITKVHCKNGNVDSIFELKIYEVIDYVVKDIAKIDSKIVKDIIGDKVDYVMMDLYDNNGNLINIDLSVVKVLTTNDYKLNMDLSGISLIRLYYV